ncbi:hypothetical protein PSPO01_14542 [Paraphaeosphaeria sporulosa]
MRGCAVRHVGRPRDKVHVRANHHVRRSRPQLPPSPLAAEQPHHLHPAPLLLTQYTFKHTTRVIVKSCTTSTKQLVGCFAPALSLGSEQTTSPRFSPLSPNTGGPTLTGLRHATTRPSAPRAPEPHHLRFDHAVYAR